MPDDNSNIQELLTSILIELKNISYVIMQSPQIFAVAHFLEKEKYHASNTSTQKYSDTISIDPPVRPL